MIYQDVRRFLKRHLKHPRNDYEWNSHDNTLLLSLLLHRYSKRVISKNEKEIIQAFKDFFESFGVLVCKFSVGEGVHYKLFPYRIVPSESKHLSALIDIIKTNREYIECPYNGNENQIALLGGIRRRINAEIAQSDEKVNKSDLIKYAIKKALNLSDKDIIILFKRKYVVKKFDEKAVRILNKHSFDAAELLEHYHEIFHEVNIDTFLDDVLEELYASLLDFSLIDYHYFERYFKKLAIRAIELNLTSFVPQEHAILDALAHFTFDYNKKAIYQRIAYEILDLISKYDPNAMAFLRYFDGKVIIEHSKRYKVPELEDKYGKKWSVQSFTSIASVWLKTMSKYKRFRAEEDNLTQRFSLLQHDEEENDLRLNTLHADFLRLLQHIKETEDEFEPIFQRNRRVKKEDNAIKKSNIVNDAMTRVESFESTMIEKLKHDVKACNSCLERLKSHLNENENAFNSVLEALERALELGKVEITNA